MQQRVLRHLDKLVSCDTQNPPRRIDPNHAIFAYIDSILDTSGGFSVTRTDHGKGRVSYFAKRGQPRFLFNVHLDTVQVGEGWAREPLQLTIEDDRAFGRGSCDTKGAAAILLALVETSEDPMALLFSTDEEGAESCCVAEFSRSLEIDRYQLIVVAEPTQCRAITAHRGYLSVLGDFSSEPGHSSLPRGLIDNANHQVALWASAAIANAHEEAKLGRDMCFNIGSMSGGTTSNVIAAKSNVHWSARLAPGSDTAATLSKFCNLTPDSRRARWNARFNGPPLPEQEKMANAAERCCARLDLEVGEMVDYWTEASLFSAVGHPAIVLGPGNIDQAHAADEWVSLDQLSTATTIYQRLLGAQYNE